MDLFQDLTSGTAMRFVIAFILVLGLIGLAAFLFRRFGEGRLPMAGGGRGRQPRLAVLDSAVVDAKRRLVLIRRDNSEHLLLIGGPSDVVIETNINRTVPAPAPEPVRRSLIQPRGAATPEPLHEPEPESSIVPSETVHEEPAPPAPPTPAPRPQPAAYSPPPPLPPRAVAHPSALSQTPAVAAPAPAPTPPPPPTPAPVSAAPVSASQPKLDPQYADMAQRLEAALRKPATVPPPAATPSSAPAVNPPRPAETRPMPQVSVPPRPAPMPPRPAPGPQEPTIAKPAPAPPPQQAADNVFDNLEAEMASLLGQDGKKS